MKSELQILIDELQKEHDLLEKEMNSCVKEMDYLGAEAYKTPFVYTKEKLRVLRHLENSNFDKINSLKHRIKHTKGITKEDFSSEIFIKRIKSRLPEYEKELKQLESIKNNFHQDKDELIICLEKIDSGELNSFDLEIEDGYICIKIFKENGGIKIVIQMKASRKEPLRRITTPQGRSELKKMSFDITEESANLWIDKFDKTKIPFVMEILSRIAYDVFRLYRDGNKIAKIKY